MVQSERVHAKSLPGAECEMQIAQKKMHVINSDGCKNGEGTYGQSLVTPVIIPIGKLDHGGFIAGHRKGKISPLSSAIPEGCGNLLSGIKN